MKRQKICWEFPTFKRLCGSPGVPLVAPSSWFPSRTFLIMSPFSCLPSPSPISLLPSPVSPTPFSVLPAQCPCSLFHSFFSRLTSHVSLLTSPISHLPSPNSGLPSPDSHLLSHITCLPSPAFSHPLKQVEVDCKEEGEK